MNFDNDCQVAGTELELILMERHENAKASNAFGQGGTQPRDQNEGEVSLVRMMAQERPCVRHHSKYSIGLILMYHHYSLFWDLTKLIHNVLKTD